MTAEEKSVLSLFMIGVLIVVGKVLAGGEPITPRLFIGRMLLGGFVSMVAGVVLVQFPDLSLPAVCGIGSMLGIRASPEQASMEFYGGKSPKIASVHQFGLSEENRKDGKKIDYPARPLLGFTGEDVQMIEEIILAHLER